MTIVSMFHRGTPARPRAELVTRISTSDGSVSLVSHPSGTDIEIYARHAGPIQIPLSRDELNTIIEIITSLRVPGSDRTQSEHLPLPDLNVATEVSAA